MFVLMNERSVKTEVDIFDDANLPILVHEELKSQPFHVQGLN
ncbi:hypothetical protein CHELA1G11_20327 [Hyphomicrobiales bacterium]|nr:hypothetical protein CHELA1G11_20327 [Hyphomicrobiales bacterium]